MAATPTRTIEATALLALLALAAGWYAQPVHDVDFWWHLLAGRRILQTGEIPSTDPFGVYESADYWAQTVLKGQWLGQVLIAAAHSAAGFEGVTALRAALLVCCLAIAYARGRRMGAAALPTLVVVAVGMMVLRGHLGERPQLFSFLFFALASLLADEAAKARHAALLALPLLFALWANVHPGVILGAVALSAWWAIGLVASRFDPRERRSDTAWTGAVVALCWLATVATPNGLTTYEYLVRLEDDPIKDRVSEYQSPLSLATRLDVAQYLPWYFGLLALAVPTLAWLARRGRWREAGVTALLAAVSLTSYRYIPFFVLYALPLVATAAGRVVAPLGRFAGAAAGLLAAAALATLAVAVGRGSAFRSGVLEELYPVESVRALRASGVGGRAFNSIGWGGYLLWSASPSIIPFIDGRLLEPGRVAPYTHVLWMTPEGRDFFEAARFDLVLVPHRNAFDPAQQPYPLVRYLSGRPDWVLARSDAKGVLFVRR